MAKQRRITSAELLAELNKDPEWVARNNERETRRRAFEEQLAEEEKELLRDVLVAGIQIESVWDFVNTKERYPAAIPVLLEHLSRPYHPKIREGIVRALTVKEAQGLINDSICAELSKETDSEVRWCLANALTVVAQPTDADRIRTLLVDKANIDICERLTVALKKSNRGKTQRKSP